MASYRNSVLFLTLAAIWGVSFMAIKAGLDYFPPVLYAAIRYDVATFAMLAYAAFTTEYWRPRTRGDWQAVFASGLLMIAAYNSFLFVGEQETTSAVAAVLVTLVPILTVGFARALLPQERLTPTGMVGVVLALVGVAIIARPDPANLLADDVIAKLLIFLAASSAALGSVLVQRANADLPSESLVAWSMGFGAIIMHAASALRPTESLAMVEWTVEAVLALGYLAIFASAIGYLLYFTLLDRLGSIEINLVSYVVPVFAAVAGWLALGETIDVYTATGFSVIVVGFVLLKRHAIADRFASRPNADNVPR